MHWPATHDIIFFVMCCELYPVSSVWEAIFYPLLCIYVGISCSRTQHLAINGANCEDEIGCLFENSTSRLILIEILSCLENLKGAALCAEF